MNTAIQPDDQTTLGELVVEHPSWSSVFERFSIDYCYGGGKTLEEACEERSLDPQIVRTELAVADDAVGPNSANPAQMSLTELCDHIEQIHHAYLKKMLPELGTLVRTVASVHGHSHPWTVELDAVFTAFSADILLHLAREEEGLFPRIRNLEQPRKDHPERLTVTKPFWTMVHEHEDVGRALKQMRELSSNYTPPTDACSTFRAMCIGLTQLEADLHRHIHKENNILFPRAMEVYRHDIGCCSNQP